ncbi:DUF192 domain-containing protein [Patescibacteria group bacterium]|nr:DUF192 domain-containing protein [Patescibacteria group bacterium]
MKKLKLKLKGVFLMILIAVILSGCTKLQQLVPGSTFSDHQIIKAQLGNSKQLELEIVNTPQSITQGLSGRDELGADGMLFVFGQAKILQFWMKEMKFDLDLIWIKDMRVVEITRNVPAPGRGVPAAQLPTYKPSQPVDMVLEVGVGQAQEWGLEVGDEVLIL